MKKWMNRLAVSLVIPALIVTVTGCQSGGTSANAPIQNRIIKAGIGLNEDHPQAQGLRKFKEIVDAKSNGKLKVQPYYSAQLGDDLKMTEALKAGLQEITIPSTSPLVGTVKEFGIFDFPYLFNDPKEADAILDGPVGKKILDKLPEHGLIGLGYWENGFRNLTNSKHPVAQAADFRGLKIRTLQTKVHIDVFKALGANPTPMPFSEVFSALESKTVDGQENPLPTIESNKFNEVQPYLSLTEHVYTPFVFLVSKKFWDRLSEEEKKILQEAAVEAGKFQREANRAQVEKSLANLKAKGMKVNEFPDEEKKKVKETIQPILDRYAKEFGPDLFEELNRELQKVRGQ
ncbi:TRAP transporter substrate-binding protein [Lihuaxuella thermophila]|uniref:Tripartite ATP-independent transporter solute receptor, DctP family n=1 Tax=Lihuaxuella thermophila TaxID=1173111 RepID=A0A1H8J8Q8_9BACL|nr:TRAP transporter substrate-binding protein [Lihuaxuella thermophila]SEN76587.1 tripartite ATP-independent transporter solute receptor, DctP family [Lihuaxuella thermophila]